MPGQFRIIISVLRCPNRAFEEDTRQRLLKLYCDNNDNDSIHSNSNYTGQVTSVIEITTDSCNSNGN